MIRPFTELESSAEQGLGRRINGDLVERRVGGELLAMSRLLLMLRLDCFATFR
jgi:hypothetical protein